MKKLVVLSLMSMFVMSSCKTEDQPTPKPNNPNTYEKIYLETRVADGNFQINDEVGVFMAYGDLAGYDNYLDNVKFTLKNDEWVSSSNFYWKDESTAANFYGYYPYNSSIPNTLKYEFEMPSDQSTEDSFKSGDFLWGSTCNVLPSSSAVALTLNHLMSKVTLKLKAGEGFSEEELLGQDLAIAFNNVVNIADINLSDGSLNLKNVKGSINPYKIDGTTYSFHMIPQSIEQCELIVVVINDSRYVMNRSFYCEGGKSYTCTLTLTRYQGGINIGIGSWDIVDGDLGGIVN